MFGQALAQWRAFSLAVARSSRLHSSCWVIEPLPVFFQCDVGLHQNMLPIVKFFLRGCGLKGIKTLMPSYFYHKVSIIAIDQWKFEQNRAKNKEVTAFKKANNHQRAIVKMMTSCGQLSVWFVHNFFSPIFLRLKKFSSLKSCFQDMSEVTIQIFKLCACPHSAV